MSADNGYVIQKTVAGKFTLQMYFASNETLPDPEKAELVFDDLESAVLCYDGLEEEAGYLCEYGLSLNIQGGNMNDENKYDEVQTPEPADQPENPLGEATDPAAAAGNAVTNTTPTESSDPNPANADEGTDATVVAAPVEQEQGGAESSDES